MLNWLKQKINPSSVSTLDQNAVLRVIGDRRSGKTTYMASLAYWPNANPDSPVQRVNPIGEEGEQLVAQAQNILEQGLALDSTDLVQDETGLKNYMLSISLKQKFSKDNIDLNINCKDYSGELFSDLIYRPQDPLLQVYLEDCLDGTGILFLLDGTAHRKDVEYAQKGLAPINISLLKTWVLTLYRLEGYDSLTDGIDRNKHNIPYLLSLCR